MKSLPKIKNFHAVQMADPKKCFLSIGEPSPASYQETDKSMLAFGHFGYKKPVLWMSGK